MGRIGITFNYWGNDWMEDIEEYERRMARAAAIGFDLMSFSQDVLFLYTPEQKKRFLGTAAEHGIRINYMAGLGPKQDVNSDSEEDRRRGVAHLRALAEKASEMQQIAGGGGATSAARSPASCARGSTAATNSAAGPTPRPPCARR